MALNQTFTPLTSGTRDNISDKGDVYYLDGNSTDGRLNISTGATWLVGDNTTVIYDGNSSHSFMYGTIKARDLKMILIPNNGGRCDFGNKNCGWDVRDMSYVYYGNGDVYNHLEDDLRISNFTGKTKFIFDMGGGRGFTQFSSQEYQNIEFDIRNTNNSEIIAYPARSSDGYTSLTGFRTIGLTELTLFGGITSTSHGRIYDPEYVDITDNLLPIKTDSASLDKRAIEYFSIDVTGIQNNETKALVENSLGTVLFNDYLTISNLTHYANDGTTPLSFYDNRNVILCEVRRISNILNSTRNQISYIIRRAGYHEIKRELFDMNSPLIISEMIQDNNYKNSIIGIEINDAQELYDEIKNVLVDNLEIENVVESTLTNLKVIDGWTLTRDQNIPTPVEIDSVNNLIKVKIGVDGLQATNDFDAIEGDVDSSFDGHTDMKYVKSNGLVNIAFNNLNSENFTLTNDYPVNILYREVGQPIWNSEVTLLNNHNIEVPPSTDYEISIRVCGYDWRTFTVNSSQYGITIDANLLPILDLNGDNLFSKTPDETQIASFVYDNVNNRMNQTNTTGNELQIDFISAYIGWSRILHEPTLVTQIDDPLIINSFRNGFLIPETNPLTVKLTDNSNANVFLNFQVQLDDAERTFARDRFIPSTGGFYISFSTTIVSGLDLYVPSPSEIRAEISPDFADVNTKLDEKPTLIEIESSNKLSMRDMVYIDTNATTNGDGTYENPYNNVSDGLDNAINNNFEKIMFMADAELDRELHNVKIYGCNHPVITVGIGFRDYECCSFYDVTLSGFFDKIEAYNCKLENANLWGTYKECSINGALSCASSEYVRLIDCYDETNQTNPPFDFIDFTNIQSGFKLLATGYDGTIGLSTCDESTADFSIHSDGGRIVLGVGMEEGTIHLYGVYNLIDSRSISTNSTLTEEIQVAKEDSVQSIKGKTDNLPNDTTAEFTTVKDKLDSVKTWVISLVRKLQ